MTERLPGKLFQDLHTKPWFSSGKVPEIKYCYTQSGLTPSCYPIRARSIIPGSKQVNVQKSFQLSEPSESFQRDFKEYHFLRENEVLVTIEHCDNCENHSNSTRHDPAKYFTLAQTLKNTILSRYPMVKILTKPLSKLEPSINHKRLGAFEVQVAKKTKGLLAVHEVHSKLASRRWPDINEVIIKVSHHLPTCQLFVTVFDENSKDKNLKGLKVQVRPKALEVEVLRPETSHSHVRPKSAVSTKSFKSIRSTSTRRSRDKEPSKKFTQQTFEKVTDRDGMCLFEGVPLDIYEIEVLDNKEFKGAIKVFNTFEEKVQNLSLNVYIGIKSRENSNFVVVLKDFLLKCEVSGAKVSLTKEAEEFSLAEVRRGVYEICVPKGDYVLQVKSNKYKEVCRKIVAKDSEVVITENLELKSAREVTVNTFDAISGESISGVFIQLLVNSQHCYEGLTKSGRFSFKLDESGQFYFKSQLAEYYKSKIYMLINAETTFVSIPLVPLTYSSPVIVISWTRFSDDIEVHGQVGTKALNFTNPQVSGYVLIDKLKSHGFSTIVLPEQGNDMRLSVAGLSKDLMKGNGFAQAGVSAQFYSFGRIRASLRPAFGTGQWWNCGVYCVEKRDFFETNFISDDNAEDFQYYEDVLNVVKYLYSVDNIENALGFIHGINKNGSTGQDLILSPEIFKKAAGNLVSEEFLHIFSQSLNVGEGISLNLLNMRYGKYVGLGLSPYRKIDSFIRDLNLDKEDLENFKRVVDEYFQLKFPKDWDVLYDENGEILYSDPQGLKINQFPTLYLCKQKINQLKSQENRSKNTSFRPKTPNSNKKDFEKNSDVSSVSNQKYGSEKRTENLSFNSKKQEKSESKFENSSFSSKKREKNEKLDNETKKFISEVNKQCEKLFNLSNQSIEFYSKKKYFDKDSHLQLIEKIEEFLINCESQLESELSKPLYDLFFSWWEKFTQVLPKMKGIEQDFRTSSQNPKKKQKKTDSSSSSPSNSV